MTSITLPDGTTTYVQTAPEHGETRVLKVLDRKASRLVGRPMHRLKPFRIVKHLPPGGSIEWKAEEVKA